MLDTDTIATSLFEKIRAQFEKVSVGDEKAKATTDPASARFFNFDFIDSNKENFGNVHISLIDDHSLKIYFGKNMTADLDEQQKKEWYDFLRDIRLFSKRNMLSFDARDISRSNLTIKDVKQLAVSDKPATTHDTNVAESKLYGTTKTSYEPIAPGTRLIIRHSGAVDETIHGARSRKIQSVYVEDAEGQRFKTPFTHLGGARVLGRHIAAGGVINDDFGNHVVDLVQEMGKIRKFIQGAKNKTFEDHEATDMVHAAKERYLTIHHILHKLKGTKGYSAYKDDYKPAKSLQDDIDLESLRSKFVQSNFDSRLEDALPHVYRAYHSMKSQEPEESPVMQATRRPHKLQAVENQVATFESWAESVTEGTWALPEDDLDMQKLQELMKSQLVAGVDGADACAALYNIVGDDSLFDNIYDASQGSPDMDVRPIIFDWLEKNMPSVAAKIDAEFDNIGSGEETPQVDPNTPMDPQTGEEVPAPEEAPEDTGSEESFDNDFGEEEDANREAEAAQQQPAESIARGGHLLADIRRLAGLK